MNFVKEIFSDIFFMYRHFLHFTLSKIIIYLVSFLYALVFFIPLVVFFFLLNLIYSGNIDIYNLEFWKIALTAIIGVILFFFAITGFSYSFVLLINLDLNYIKRKLLAFSKNYYFNIKLFWNYAKLFWLYLAIIFSPFIIGGILILFFIGVFGGFENVYNLVSLNSLNSFSIISFIIFIISFLFFIYLAYKTLFSFIILVDKSKGQDFKKTFYYIKKSFKITKGYKKALKFFLLLILIILISSPFSYFSNRQDKNLRELKDYFIIKSQNINDFSSDYVFYLNKKYSNLKKEELINLYLKNLKLYFLAISLNFLFVIGLYEMFWVSFYKRVLKLK